MKTDIRNAALASLSASSHAHKGIRPAGAADQEADCRLLAGDDPQGFDDAVAAAQSQWPGKTEWDLVASDYAIGDPLDNIAVLGMPYTLARFSTFDGDGSSEDPGGASDF